ncbi:hypothetical protein C8R47DRAFT_1251942 [Mycena vitilis]|nr:hypothetical protein C8R47DRAFT_1251942 [Mycena vitilis]
MSFSLDHNIFSRLLVGLVVPGVALTTGLLILYAYVAWDPVSRRYMDRVSFRLLVYGLLGNLFLAIALALSTLGEFPRWRCSLFAFGANVTLEFTAGIFFCMALNLPLVLAYKVNGQKMEKWYILGTVSVTLVCNIVPYASGKLGWASSQACWYRSPTPTALYWLIGTQTIWTLLTCVGEVVAFMILLGYLVAYEFETWRLGANNSRFKETQASEVSYRPALTIRMFRSIIFRIGLYPLVSCLLNVTSAVLDLQVMSQESPSMALSIVDFAIPASRPLIYGVLAATDPAFLRALRVRLYPESESEPQASHMHLNAEWADPCLTTIIEMEADEFASGARNPAEKIAPEQVQLGTHDSATLGSMADVEFGRVEPTTQTPATTVVYHPRLSTTLDVVHHI